MSVLPLRTQEPLQPLMIQPQHQSECAAAISPCVVVVLTQTCSLWVCRPSCWSAVVIHGGLFGFFCFVSFCLVSFGLVSSVWFLLFGFFCLVSSVWCLLLGFFCLVSSVWSLLFGFFCLVAFCLVSSAWSSSSSSSGTGPLS